MPGAAGFPLGTGRTIEWVAVAAAVLLAVSLASIWRARGYSRHARIIWTVVATVLPIIGPIAWMLAGREPRRRRREP